MMILGLGTGAISRFEGCSVGAGCVDNSRIYLDAGVLSFLFGVALVIAGFIIVDPTWMRKGDVGSAADVSL